MRTQARKYYVEALVVAGVMTLASGIYAALSFSFQGLPLNDHVRVVVSFLCFGLLLGTIFAFDAESDMKVGNRPFIRCGVGCLCGAVTGAIWQWPVEAIVLSAIVGAILGLLGMTWARFADF
jgi:uncharacterized membrane protein